MVKTEREKERERERSSIYEFDGGELGTCYHFQLFKVPVTVFGCEWPNWWSVDSAVLQQQNTGPFIFVPLDERKRVRAQMNIS